MVNEMDEIKIVGDNIKKMRERYGYSQKEIGAIMNVSFQQVQKYENGINRLPIDKLYALKELYDIPYEVFFEGIDEKRDTENMAERMNVICSRILQVKDTVLKRKICDVVSVVLD